MKDAKFSDGVCSYSVADVQRVVDSIPAALREEALRTVLGHRGYDFSPPFVGRAEDGSTSTAWIEVAGYRDDDSVRGLTRISPTAWAGDTTTRQAIKAALGSLMREGMSQGAARRAVAIILGASHPTFFPWTRNRRTRTWPLRNDAARLPL